MAEFPVLRPAGGAVKTRIAASVAAPRTVPSVAEAPLGADVAMALRESPAHVAAAMPNIHDEVAKAMSAVLGPLLAQIDGLKAEMKTFRPAATEVVEIRDSATQLASGDQASRPAPPARQNTARAEAEPYDPARDKG